MNIMIIAAPSQGFPYIFPSPSHIVSHLFLTGIYLFYLIQVSSLYLIYPEANIPH